MPIIKKYILILLVTILLWSCTDLIFIEEEVFSLEYIAHTVPRRGIVNFNTYAYDSLSSGKSVKYAWQLFSDNTDMSDNIVPDPDDQSEASVDFSTLLNGSYTIIVTATNLNDDTETLSMPIDIAEPNFVITSTKEDIYISTIPAGKLSTANLTYYLTSLMFQPILESEMDNTTRLDAGHNFVIAIDNTTKQVFSKGSNNLGQLGLDSNIDSKIFQAIPNFTTIDNISAGYGHVLALADNGSVYSWGDNTYGQLGYGDNQSLKSPKEITFLKDKKIVEVIAGGDFSMAIADNKTIYTWGDNRYGQLGHGNIIQLNTPTEIASFKAKDIDLGEYHVVAIDNDTGLLYAWGNNKSNKLGILNNSDNITSPTKINTYIDNAEIVAATNSYSTMIDSTGKLYYWGFVRSDLILQTVPAIAQDPHGIIEPIYDKKIWATRDSIIIQESNSKALYRWGNLLQNNSSSVWNYPLPIEWILFNDNTN